MQLSPFQHELCKALNCKDCSVFFGAKPPWRHSTEMHENECHTIT